MPAKLDRCVKDVLASGQIREYPGRTKEESAYAICNASIANKAFGGRLTPELIKAVQESRWPQLSKEARGEPLEHVVSLDIPVASATAAQTSKAGMSHFVAPDNGSYYAELWSRGGSWYAVTNAGLHEIEGVKKGDTIYQAMPKFMAAITKASCAPCAAAAAAR